MVVTANRRYQAALGGGWLVVLLALLAWGTEAPGDEAENRPIHLLERMAQALATRDFDGTLVYLHGQQLATLRVAQRRGKGATADSILALNGPLRAVARTERGVACLLPGIHPILIDRAADSAAMHDRSRPLNIRRLATYYRIEALGPSRVAGRPVDIVAVMPRDSLRYGYRFFIDRATALPLKTELTDAGAELIEQVMFIEFRVTPARESVRSAPSEQRLPHPPARSGSGSRWMFEYLPAGFELVGRRSAGSGPEERDAEQFLFSDGLAAMSLYIEPAGAHGLAGVTRMGAVHAAGRRIGTAQITAVGEVPAAAVERLLDGVRERPVDGG